MPSCNDDVSIRIFYKILIISLFVTWVFPLTYYAILSNGLFEFFNRIPLMDIPVVVVCFLFGYVVVLSFFSIYARWRVSVMDKKGFSEDEVMPWWGVFNMVMYIKAAFIVVIILVVKFA